MWNEYDSDYDSDEGPDLGFCTRCGVQLDGGTPPSSVVCWECAGEEEGT